MASLPNFLGSQGPELMLGLLSIWTELLLWNLALLCDWAQGCMCRTSDEVGHELLYTLILVFLVAFLTRWDGPILF